MSHCCCVCRVGTRPASAMAPVGAARSRPRGGGSAYARSPRDAWRILSTGSRRGTGPHGRYVCAWLHGIMEGVCAWLHGIFGGVCAWLHGCMGGVSAWLHGCTGGVYAWLHSRYLHGCMVAWLNGENPVFQFPSSLLAYIASRSCRIPRSGRRWRDDGPL